MMNLSKKDISKQLPQFNTWHIVTKLKDKFMSLSAEVNFFVMNEKQRSSVRFQIRTLLNSL